MRLLIQRVKEASVSIEGVERSRIGEGLLVFVGIEDADTEEDIQFLSNKLLNLRIFDDSEGVMNCSLLQLNKELLVVSQFTLMASTKKGNRPSYIRAAKHELAIPLYERFCTTLSQLLGRTIATGQFAADMQVALINDGPVTIWMDSKNKE